MKAFPWGKVPEERGRMRGIKQAYPHPSRACVRRASHLPPREGFGERIATPVCGLVRNDMCFKMALKNNGNLIRLSEPPIHCGAIATGN